MKCLLHIMKTTVCIMTIALLACTNDNNNQQQEQESTISESKVYDAPTFEGTYSGSKKLDSQPIFPGDVMKWVDEQLRYPAEAKLKGIEGKVIVQFIITSEGAVTDVRTINTPDSLLINEAERIVRIMPKWQPAIEKGKPVNVKYTMPINFKLGYKQ